MVHLIAKLDIKNTKSCLGGFMISAFKSVKVGLFSLALPVLFCLFIISTSHAARKVKTVQTGSITGTVYLDQDGNGLRDAVDEGVAGVTVELNGPVTMVATTGPDGDYSFISLPVGDYTVTAFDLAGYLSTTPNVFQFAVGTEAVTGIDFGDVWPLTLSGTVFKDVNQDGKLNFSEVGIAGIEVRLHDDLDGDGVLDEGEPLRVATTTDVDGFYSINGQLPGPVVLVEIDPSGYMDTTPDTIPIYLLSQGINYIELNFGNLPLAGINGTVWDDFNGDEEIDTGEMGLPGVVLNLVDDTNANGQVDLGEPVVGSSVTDGAGVYEFTDLIPDYYILEVDDSTLPLGYITSDGLDPLPVILIGGQVDMANFGFYSPQTADPGGVGYWKREFHQLGNPDFTISDLDALVDRINDDSAVFANAKSPDESLLRIGYKTMRERAEQQLAALWLNSASGLLPPCTPVDLGSLSTAATAGEALLEADTIVGYRKASDSDLERAKKIADALNNRHSIY
jgi:uncharacterized protein (DUF2141 family)